MAGDVIANRDTRVIQKQSPSHWVGESGAVVKMRMLGKDGV